MEEKNNVYKTYNISAIITTYKREWEKLEHAIQSILKQKYPVKEILIIDDNPEDNIYSKSIAFHINSINKSLMKKHSLKEKSQSNKEDAGIEQENSLNKKNGSLMESEKDNILLNENIPENKEEKSNNNIEDPIIEYNPEDNLFENDSIEKHIEESILEDDFYKKYPDIRRISTDHNMGPAGARNFGVCMARYEYIAFLDDDDEWTSDHTEILIDILKNNPDADIAYGVGYEKDDITKEADFNWQWMNFVENPSLEDILENDYIGPPQILMKKESFEKAGGFTKMPAYEDYELWIKMIKTGYKAVGKKYPVYVRHMDETEHVSQNRKNCFKALRMIYAFYREDYEKFPKAKKQILWNISREGIFAHDIRVIPYIIRWFFAKLACKKMRTSHD